MRVRFLGQEDPLEEGMAAHFSILAWRRQRSLAGYGPQGHKELDITEATQHPTVDYNYQIRLGKLLLPYAGLCIELEDYMSQENPEKQ